MTRVTESFTTGPEAKGIYPSPNICCYLRYKCAYCERQLVLVVAELFLLLQLVVLLLIAEKVYVSWQEI